MLITHVGLEMVNYRRGKIYYILERLCLQTVLLVKCASVSNSILLMLFKCIINRPLITPKTFADTIF